MKGSIVRRLAVLLSLLILPLSYQPLYAADKTVSAASTAGVEKINVNKADVQTLSMIKGIGTTKAQAIIDYRTSMGKFKSLDELIKVKGIGQATLQKIAPYLTL